MKAAVDEGTFITVWHETGGSAAEVARRLGVAERNVHARRSRIEAKKGIVLASRDNRTNRPRVAPPGRMTHDLQNGTVLVGSDAHVWPSGELTTAQRGFIHLAKTLKPDVIVLNGDVFDGATVSRFPAGSWAQEERPSVQQELEACQAFCDAIVKAYPAKRFWCLGNHDMRLEARLAAVAPQYKNVFGTALKDHFPEWQQGMSLWIGDTVIKHRWHGGLHAPHLNALKSGRSMVTGHLHSLKVTPWTDYTGDRYGVDCGTLADPFGPQFDYVEDAPRAWRAGGAWLTYKDGRLLMPELFSVWDEDTIQFRGQLIRV